MGRRPAGSSIGRDGGTGVSESKSVRPLLLGLAPVHLVNVDQRAVALAAARLAGGARDLVAGAQLAAADLRAET